MIRTVAFGLVLGSAGSLLLGQSEQFGAWKTLFNGKDTSGWVVAKSRGQLKAGGAPAGWSVAEGALTNGRGGVEDICTLDQYDNYELEIEYMIPEGGNSGVYSRGQVEIQVAHSQAKEAAKLGPGDAGGIYGKSAPAANPQNPPGEWNKFHIRHIGNRILVWHNGVLVQDNVYIDGETGGAMRADPATGNPLKLSKGPIMLQGDHTKVSYRAIRARPLASPADGWRPIWNGEDLSAFDCRGAKVEENWTIDDHAFANRGRRRDMWTKEPFGNFLVHYEYRSDPQKDGGNSGFYLRDQWEIQIHSRSSTENKHSDGALYSIYAPAQSARHGPLNWNHMDAKVDGMKIWVWQNGKLIHDGAVCATRTDDHGTKTDTFKPAPFKFQGDHGDVWFTNLYVKPLPER